MKRRIITLLTDFGLQDPYVSVMKGVILTICPTAEIVDISHQIGKFNIREAAFKLAFTAKYFEPNTIHLVVVDPGVGSSRKSLIISTENYFFIGPDNGVLSLAAEKDGIKRIIEITNEDLFLKPVSNTFHGRDIFAPVAAHVANHIPLNKIGSDRNEMIKLSLTKAAMISNEIFGEVLYTDGFGNIVTNINSDLLKKLNISHKTKMEIEIKAKLENIILCNSYNEVKKGELLGIIGSSGNLEISANQKSAANLLNAEINDKIRVRVFKV